MKNHKKFLQKTDTAMPSWERLNVLINQYKSYKKIHTVSLKVLDIGCGKNAYINKSIHKKDQYFGCDYYNKINAEIKNYTQIDLNEEELHKKYKGQKFDVIFCGEVIEHIFSPDHLLDEIKKLMHDESILILSTPNLSYYVNRILLLFGISPLFLENSSEKKLGRKFKSLGQGNITEGHIRVFTYGALRDLFALKKLEVVSITPHSIWGFFPDRYMHKVSKSLASDNIFVLRKGR